MRTRFIWCVFVYIRLMNLTDVKWQKWHVSDTWQTKSHKFTLNTLMMFRFWHLWPYMTWDVPHNFECLENIIHGRYRIDSVDCPSTYIFWTLKKWKSWKKKNQKTNRDSLSFGPLNIENFQCSAEDSTITFSHCLHSAKWDFASDHVKCRGLWIL